MTFLISLPGGTEWIILLLGLLFLIVIPIMAISLYTRNKDLRRQIDALTTEKNTLLKKVLEKS